MNLTISSSPHLQSRVNTPYLMLQVIIALLPAAGYSVHLFGARAVFLIFNCVITAIITEAVIQYMRKKPQTVTDGSAALSGLLLALILPPSIKWYAASLGSIFAIFIGKHVFGGLGSNVFNPALIGRAFLMAAYPKMLTVFITPNSVNAVTKATPLALRKFNNVITPTLDLFWGNISGSLGETSAFCLILGGFYLLIFKIADWRIPFSLLASLTLIAGIGAKLDPANGSILFHLFSGGVLLGAFFMATDPVTTPATKKGRCIFGAVCGCLIMIIRYFSGFPEGTMYSILFMNALTPLINRYTRPKPFGWQKT